MRKNKDDEDDWRPPAKTTSRKRPKTWAANQTASQRKALLTNKKKKADARPVVEDDDNINAQYYEDFRQHVVDLRAHLAGKLTEENATQVSGMRNGDVEMEVDSDEDSNGGEPSDPFIATTWTEVEKDAFFHAVATHSRLRPDLIAASVKTKNMYDVCLYMRYLDDSLAKLKEHELNFAPDPTVPGGGPEEEPGGSSEEEGLGEAGQDNGENPPAGEGEDSGPNKPRAFESDASKKARRDAKLHAAALAHRNAAPCAMEMTVPWIEFEEGLAKVLCDLEDDDQRRGGDVAFTSATVAQDRSGPGSPGKKQRTDKKDKGKGKAEEPVNEGGRASPSSPPQVSRSETSSQKDMPTADPSNHISTEPAWKTSNVYFLDGHLQVLETILRDAEDARAAADFAGQSSFIQEKMQRRSRGKSRAPSPPPDASEVHGDEIATEGSSTFRVVGLQDSSSPEGQRASTSKLKGTTEAAFDSMGDENMGRDDVDSNILHRRKGREGSVASTSASSSRPPPKSRLKSQWKSETKGKPGSSRGGFEEGCEGVGEREAGGDENNDEQNRGEEEGEEERALRDPDLCPTVRRRFLNRIYMRKRRAMKSGGLEAVEAVDTKSVRLKPGRRKKNADPVPEVKSRSTSGEQESTAKVGGKRKREGSDGEEESEADEGENTNEDLVNKRDKGDRFWGEIDEAGIDEATLVKEGMAYFNLSMLGKLLNYFSTGYRDRTISGQPAVSASLVRALFTTVVEFLVDVIHRSVVLSECRASVRTGSKVFRQNNEYVTVESVKLALEIVGQPLEDRKAFLSRVLSDKHAQPPLRGTIIQPTTPTAELAGMTFHRSLYLPFIQLPREYGGRGVGEEEDDAVEERRRKRGYLEVVEDEEGSEGELEDVHSDADSDEDGGTDDEDGGGSDRRRESKKRKGKDKPMEHDTEAMEEEGEEDLELLALCDDPVLPLWPNDAEDEQYDRVMAEEEELDTRDMSAAKRFEADVWDRTLKAGELLPE